MSRAVFGSLILGALALALALRLAQAGARPMHHDEANQAVKFGVLLETGHYDYDRTDHHGPTLYYLTLPFAWLRGQATLASLDERTIRLVPAVFGAGLILLLPFLASALGRPAIAAAALLAALSPALTYYSRFYIQESLFVFFVMTAVIALGRYVERPGTAAAVAAGLFGGLAYATKETSVIVAAAAVAAAVAARWSVRPASAGAAGAPPVRAAHGAAAAATALAVAFVFYSSFLRHPGGLVQSALAYGVYLERGVGAVAHAQPWYHYLALLAVSKSGGLVWSEGLILLLAAVGIVGAAGKSAGFWPRYLALYALLATIAFSAVRYKTPWNLLPFYSALVVMAGAGTVTLLGWVRPRAPRIALAVVLAAAATQLGVQNWRASVRHGADPRNPYAYVHTSTDFLRLVQRVSDVSRLHPDGASMFVKVLAGPYEQWPLPWYLRRMARVGYWTNATEAADAGDAPVVIASQDVAPQVDAALGDRYVSELYGLRPEVFLTLYVERGSWERLLAARGAAPPAER